VLCGVHVGWLDGITELGKDGWGVKREEKCGQVEGRKGATTRTTFGERESMQQSESGGTESADRAGGRKQE